MSDKTFLHTFWHIRSTFKWIRKPNAREGKKVSCRRSKFCAAMDNVISLPVGRAPFLFNLLLLSDLRTESCD
eukprot:5502524-Amphidinium_carterae.1